MPVSKKIDSMMSRSSWIRRMFEEGNRLRPSTGPTRCSTSAWATPTWSPPSSSTRWSRICWPTLGRACTATCPTPASRRRARPWRPISRKSRKWNCRAPTWSCAWARAARSTWSSRPCSTKVTKWSSPTPYFVEYDTYVDNHGASAGTCRPRPTSTWTWMRSKRPSTRARGSSWSTRPTTPPGGSYSRESLEALAAVLRRKSAEHGPHHLPPLR